MKKLILSILIIATLTACNQSQELTQYYTVTEASNGEYYGSNENNNIYFITDTIKGNKQIKAGDKIKAVFENEYDDSLLYVSKVN